MNVKWLWESDLTKRLNDRTHSHPQPAYAVVQLHSTIDADNIARAGKHSRESLSTRSWVARRRPEQKQRGVCS